MNHHRSRRRKKKLSIFFFVLPLIFHASLFIFQGLGRQTTFCVMRFYIGHGCFVNITQKKAHILILSNVQVLSSVSCRSCFGFDFYFGLSCLILGTHLPSSCFLFSFPHYLVCKYLSCLLCSVPMLYLPFLSVLPLMLHIQIVYCSVHLDLLHCFVLL